MKWNGYKFWMAMTPYPNGNSAYENPSILVSDDGQTWLVPPGLTNPIEPAPATGHYSDPDILEGKDGKLWVFFQWGDNTTNKIYVKSSSDGINWSSKTEILSSTVESFLSPAVIREDYTYRRIKKSTFTMWYIDHRLSPNVLKKRTANYPTGIWSDSTTLTVNGIPSGKDIWHIDVIKNGNEYHAFVVLVNEGTNGTNAKLHFAKSSDGINWTLDNTPFLDKSTNNWDNDLIYRGTVVLLDAGYEKRYALWYSAMSSAGVWHIGYTEIYLGVIIQRSDKVGIGTPNPGAKLDIHW